MGVHLASPPEYKVRVRTWPSPLPFPLLLQAQGSVGHRDLRKPLSREGLVDFKRPGKYCPPPTAKKISTDCRAIYRLQIYFDNPPKVLNIFQLFKFNCFNKEVNNKTFNQSKDFTQKPRYLPSLEKQ